MKVFMIGATGLLGLAGAKELIKRGHEVSGLALPPIPQDLDIPKELKLELGNFMEMNDDEIKSAFKDCDSFVFAAGVDERVEGPAPIYDMFKKFNIDALKRLLDIAKECGVKNVCVLGSYFSYFAKQWPELELTKHHPYIRSRIDQEELAFSYAEDGMNVSILEIPYVFGAQKGRKPVWQFIAEMIHNTKGKNLLYPKGGTTMVTVNQMGQAIAGALENTKGALAYPVGWYNMTWVSWLEYFSICMNEPKKVKTIPTFLYTLNAKKMTKEISAAGKESGLNMIEYAKVMTANAFIDKKYIEAIGVKEDDINSAIKESAIVCLDIINNPEKSVVDMKIK